MFSSFCFIILRKSESQGCCFPIISHIFSRTDLRKGNESSLFGKFPLSESLSTKYKLWTRTVDYGQAQLSVKTDHKKGAYLVCKIRRNRPNGQTHAVSNSNPLGIKRFDSGISISFKSKCHIIMQIQYNKNLNPWRFELDTTLSKPTRSIMLE